MRNRVNFICNCCGCCCEALVAIRRFDVAQTICSNFIAEISTGCVGCGKCVKVCPLDAIEMAEGGGGAQVVETACVGCGICIRHCPTKALRLQLRPNRLLTPMDTTHRAVVMATERGKLQELIFDNKALFSHRLLAGVLGSILRLPGVSRGFAQAQLKSRCLETLITKASTPSK